MDFWGKHGFLIGCNYWASHAGTHMWWDWRPEIVEEDFRRLAENSVKVLRVFPLWPAFQPITMLYGANGEEREVRFGEEPLPDTEAGQVGLSEEMLARFDAFCKLAEKYELRLIVGLVTGWMSGRLFVPPALEGRNVLTDPAAILWETRFVRHFVGRFRNQPAIAAWDLGNECNCMAPVESAEQFYVWTSSIVGAIRSQDSTRPVVSGMHSLLPHNKWPIQHQAELTDILTTHPYACFTPHCDLEPLNTIRTELHGTAETLFYRGIGGKPCFVEECGTLGPMFADEEHAAAFVRTSLLSLWAHDCRGFLWWCANEQSHLERAPYDWSAVERELGLFRTDGSHKPVLGALRSFAALLDSLPFDRLPSRMTEGVCVLTKGQDAWGAAYMSFLLAKQAGLDIEFAYADQPLPPADLYLLPSVCGDTAISRRRLQQLLERVEKGATLYLSVDNGLLSPFSQYTGVKVLTRERADSVTLAGEEGLSLPCRYRLRMEPCGAEVLAADEDGLPVFTRHAYGKGQVFCLIAPLETGLLDKRGAFDGGGEYTRFYSALKATLPTRKAAALGTPCGIGLTEHPLDDSRRILVLVNYTPDEATADLVLAPGWEVAAWHSGAAQMPGNSGAVVEIHAKPNTRDTES